MGFTQCHGLINQCLFILTLSSTVRLNDFVSFKSSATHSKVKHSFLYLLKEGFGASNFTVNQFQLGYRQFLERNRDISVVENPLNPSATVSLCWAVITVLTSFRFLRFILSQSDRPAKFLTPIVKHSNRINSSPDRSVDMVTVRLHDGVSHRVNPVPHLERVKRCNRITDGLRVVVDLDNTVAILVIGDFNNTLFRNQEVAIGCTVHIVSTE